MASRTIFRTRVAATGAAVAAGRASAPSAAPAFLGRLVAVAEGLAYSSGLAALVGSAMTWAAGRALAAPDVARAAALVGCGAFFIYNVDRLRDLTRDRPSSPDRTAFVLRHRAGLVAATGLAGLALAALLATSPGPFAALALAVGAIGLLHRRLKRDVRFKIAYVAAAWTAACVGLPWLGAFGEASPLSGRITFPAPGAIASPPAAGETVAWSILFIGAGVVANLIASNRRVGKSNAPGRATETTRLAARGLALAVLCAAVAAPTDVAPLAWIPAAEAVALLLFRETERFGHLAVDGALLMGALAAIAQTSL